MVVFDRTNKMYSLTINGSEEDYFNTLRALSRMISSVDTDLIEKNTIFYVSNLLAEMLPSPEQSVKIEIE